MTGGDLAGLIAAAVFAVLVGLLAVPLLKLGRVLDETRIQLHVLGENVTPMLTEATTTIREANTQLARVDTITRGVADATANVSSLIALFAATLGGPLIKIAGFTAGIRAAILSHRAWRSAK